MHTNVKYLHAAAHQQLQNSTSLMRLVIYQERIMGMQFPSISFSLPQSERDALSKGSLPFMRADLSGAREASPEPWGILLEGKLTMGRILTNTKCY